MKEFGRGPGKAGIRASIEKLSQRVPKKGQISVSIEKLSRRLLKNGRISVSTEEWWHLGKYREK